LLLLLLLLMMMMMMIVSSQCRQGIFRVLYWNFDLSNTATYQLLRYLADGKLQGVVTEVSQAHAASVFTVLAARSSEIHYAYLPVDAT
jgi:cation transport regulator ChaC